MEKVIAFVSVFSPAFNINADADKYYYGDEGEYVEGKQTNEAPLKYLLRKHRDIDEVICIVSPEVLVTPKWDPEVNKNITEDGFNLKFKGHSPYGYLQEQINAFIKKPEEGFSADKSVTFTEINLSKPTYECFSMEVIPKIKEIVRPGDSILFETSGGPRINVIQMMFLARMLRYQKIELKGAVYSEYNRYEPNRLYDVTKYFYDFDLVSGLNEFVSTGATELLDSYFKKSPSSSDTVKELLLAMNDLNKTIILGRISMIQSKRENVEEKLESAQKELDAQKDNPILSILLEQFREKYKPLSNTPELIKWCAGNNLIQLAFTLYKDWIPEYLMTTARIFYPVNDTSEYETEKDNSKENKTLNLYYFIMRNYFFKDQALWLKNNEEDIKEKYGIRYVKKDWYISVIDNISILKKEPVRRFEYNPLVDPDLLQCILQDYLYATIIRNELNHASQDDKKYRKAYLEKIKIEDDETKKKKSKYIFKEEDLDIAYLKAFLINAMDQIVHLTDKITSSAQPVAQSTKKESHIQ